MTVARPVVAFITAAVAGITENLLGPNNETTRITPDLTCPVDGCCDGENCSPEKHRRHHSFGEKLSAGMRFAVDDLWGDLAGWFMIGMILAGLITVLIPPDMFGKYLSSGLPAMLIMLAVGIPLYICATASTPIAAALILKGVSPGAALVFLLAGPATNIASLTVLTGVLGKRATAIYLTSIAVCAVLFGLIVDQVYASLGISAQAVVGQASEIVPEGVGIIGALIILVMSIKPVWGAIRERFKPAETQKEDLPEPRQARTEPLPVVSDCCPNCDGSSDSRNN